MTPEELVAAAPELLRQVGVQASPDDLERMAVLLRRRQRPRAPARTTEPALTLASVEWEA
ncbi:MAG: hypothetical protein ACSLFM_00780 [Tepidiformaceae bacterium]